MSSKKRTEDDTVTEPPREKKRISFKMSPEVMDLAKKMMSPEMMNMAEKIADATPSKIDEIEPTPPPCPRPTRIVTKHEDVTASLCINAKGFSLFNGVETVTNFSVNHSHLAEVICEMRIKHLRIFDQKTLKIWSDIKQSYPQQLKHVQHYPVEQIPQENCNFCNTADCHRWNAVALLSHFHNLKFKNMKH